MHRGKTKNGSLRRRAYPVNRLLVEEKDKRKGWTRIAQDWDGPVCRSAFSLTIWCSTAVAASPQNHSTLGFFSFCEAFTYDLRAGCRQAGVISWYHNQ